MTNQLISRIPTLKAARLLGAGLLSVLILIASGRVAGDPHSARADFFEWNAETQGTGIYGFLRQRSEYQEKDGTDITGFYATKTIWLFGTGEAMLLQWLPQDIDGRKFKIAFSYLNDLEVSEFVSKKQDKSARDALVAKYTGGALTQTTSTVFDGQAGLYDRVGDFPGYNHWLPEIILESDEFKALLDHKYPTGAQQPDGLEKQLNQSRKDKALALKDDLALDAQVYPASGQFRNDDRLAIYFPGYTPGTPTTSTTKEGWNNSISMGKDPELFMNAQGLTYQDLANDDRYAGVIIGWNTHLDYDGQQTRSKDVAPDEADHVLYRGILSPVGQNRIGLVRRVMALLDTGWADVPLTGDRNIVSHSTGYYLAMDMLHYMPDLWPESSKNRYFAISPNIRGSTMIGSSGGPQKFDSQDDMFRDNWHFDGGYKMNEATRGLMEYRKLDDVEAHVMLSYGDMTSAGVGGLFSAITFDMGVVDYTNYNKPLSAGTLDDNEYGRRKRFSVYESLYNMQNDGGALRKSEVLPEWNNGGDDYLRNFPDDTVISVFGENVNLFSQKADDSEDYDEDHSDLAQRMMIMKMIVSGGDVDYVPAPGTAVEVVSSEETPGTVVFQWDRSKDQASQDTDGWIGGQLYEIVRRIEGNNALDGWTDRWWHRVGLKRAESGSEFSFEYRTYETIRNVDDAEGGDHGLWQFDSDIDDEFINVPTWLDQSFNKKDLWVRVLNGPLRGGFFKVAEVQDRLGEGYEDSGALGIPNSFPDKEQITLTVLDNPAYRGEQPDADEGAGVFSTVNYITLGGIKYQYNTTFYGPVDPVRNAVKNTQYTDLFKIFNPLEQDEENQKGQGHFMSVELAESVSYETDTISPTISFGGAG